MTAPLASFMWLELVAVSDTPPELVALGGRQLGLPPEYVTQLGSGPGNPGTLFPGSPQPIRGYHQVGGTTGHQWVMTGALGQAALQVIDAIPVDQTLPGSPGWMPVQATLLDGSSASVRQVYVVTGRRLVTDYSLPLPDVRTVLNNLYVAARANRDAQRAG